MKKKPAAIIDSDSEEEFVPKEHKKTDKASKIDSSSEEDDFTVCWAWLWGSFVKIYPRVLVSVWIPIQSPKFTGLMTDIF